MGGHEDQEPTITATPITCHQAESVVDQRDEPHAEEVDGAVQRQDRAKTYDDRVRPSP